MKTRVSAQQKNALLAILYVEIKFGLHTPVNTSYIKKCVDASLSKESHSNHFSVSLRALADNDYLVYQQNTGKFINSRARENENMWQLTNKGRAYAEGLNSAMLRPKRSYTKASKK